MNDKNIYIVVACIVILGGLSSGCSTANKNTSVELQAQYITRGATA